MMDSCPSLSSDHTPIAGSKFDFAFGQPKKPATAQNSSPTPSQAHPAGAKPEGRSGPTSQPEEGEVLWSTVFPGLVSDEEEVVPSKPLLFSFLIFHIPDNLTGNLRTAP